MLHIHEILSAMNNKQIVGVIFCHLCKAFDCVNHKILLSKLDHYGIRGTFKALIDSYLKERYQSVTIKKKQHPLLKLGISQIWCTTDLGSWPSAVSTVHK
jgi:hypothetical protein